LRGREAGTSPFVCTHRTHVAGTVRKLVHTKRILVHFCVVAGTGYKSSANDATLKIEVILSMLHDARIQTSWISSNMLRGQNFVTAAQLFRKNGHVTRGKLSLQHVPASCPATCLLVCAEVVGRRKPTSILKCFKLSLSTYLAWLQSRITVILEDRTSKSWQMSRPCNVRCYLRICRLGRDGWSKDCIDQPSAWTPNTANLRRNSRKNSKVKISILLTELHAFL